MTQEQADAELMAAFGPAKRAMYKKHLAKLMPLELEYLRAVREIAIRMPTMKARSEFYDRVGMTRPKL